jgi:hypothetical protein
MPCDNGYDTEPPGVHVDSLGDIVQVPGIWDISLYYTRWRGWLAWRRAPAVTAACTATRNSDAGTAPALRQMARSRAAAHGRGLYDDD